MLLYSAAMKSKIGKSIAVTSKALEPGEALTHSYVSYFLSGASDEPEDKTSQLDQIFNRLAKRWYSETRRLASAEQMVLHPAYQQIIGMGKDALPLIFKELNRTRGHWIWALAMILRDDKAKPGMNFREAVDAWLAWGRNNGYI
jgi:hypothetical protein